MSDIPIVGQPARIIHIYPVTLVECRCQAEKGAMSMVIIGGIGGYVACGHCGKQYAVKQFMANDRGGIDAILDVLIPPPGAGGVM